MLKYYLNYAKYAILFILAILVIQVTWFNILKKY